MKAILLILFLILTLNTARSQDLRRNTLYLELGGASFFYSINYDYLLFKNRDINLSTRLGYMYLNFFNENSRVMHGLPVSLSVLKRIGKKYLEVGISGSVIFDDYYSMNQYGFVSGYVNDMIIMPSVRAGIRRQPAIKRFFWNALAQFSMVAVADRYDFNHPEVHIMPLVSFGIGYSFK